VPIEKETGDNFTSHLNIESLARTLLENNFPVHYNLEEVNITVDKEIILKIDKLFFKHIIVNEKEVSVCHPIWSETPRNLVSPVDLISELKTLSERWHVCESLRKAHIASLLQNKFQCDLSSFGDAISALESAKTCLLLCSTKQEVCASCKLEYAKLKKKAARRARRGNETSINTNIKHMSQEEAKQCVRRSRHALKLEKRKTRRLRLRIQGLIRRNGIQIGESGNDDLKQIHPMRMTISPNYFFKNS
jgi:hypothetical protein